MARAGAAEIRYETKTRILRADIEPAASTVYLQRERGAAGE
jgi:hypothetical protein